MNAETLVIINNAAARARRSWPELRKKLHNSGIRFEAHETTEPGDATSKTRSAIREGFKTIAVVGGDGTISETVEGFFDLEKLSDTALPTPIKSEARLAILPAGTGDDFARGLIKERASTDDWASRLINYLNCPATGSSQYIDAVYGIPGQKTKPFIFINISTLGIGPEVAAGVSSQYGLLQKLPGEARFVTAAFSALIAWRERRLRITINAHKSIECSSNLVAVANSVYAGGGMMFAPDARTDDGLLNLMIARNLNRRGIVRELPRIRTGGHVANPKVNTFHCARVRIEHLTPDDPLLIEADGNLRGHTPVEFRVMPKALSIIV